MSSGFNSNSAVVFTHFGGLDSPGGGEFHLKTDELINEYKNVIKSYMDCNIGKLRIGIVYVYLDWAVKKIIPSIKIREDKDGRIEFDFPSRYSMHENELIDVLRKAEDLAKKEAHPDTKLPEIIYVGLTRLVGVLQNLVEVEKSLVEFLGGGKGSAFGYDSPKFVEAIIRIARGDVPHLAGCPIIRIDEDAKPDIKSIETLVERFSNIVEKRLFYFFSGRYKRFDHKNDPINDHAVRVHWFFPPGTIAGDPRYDDKSDGEFQEGIKQARTFLADLSYLGAWQAVDGVYENISTKMSELIKEGKISKVERISQQVTSGAGLIMSRRAVRLLPPFMNFLGKTIWVDDHLKRRLHEGLQDIFSNHIESIEDALFEQDRHPKGLTKDFIDGTVIGPYGQQEYLRRLFSGCIFHEIISVPSKEYVTKVLNIVSGRDINLDEIQKESLKNTLVEIGIEHGNKVLQCWTSREFENTISSNWAKKIINENIQRTIVEEIVDDAIGYLELLKNWPIFITAIERLPMIGNEWLYRSV